MKLSPEERRKIYEEEKARLEAESSTPEQSTNTGLTPNVAGLLCYLGIWVTGLIFIFLEQKNQQVRFHAAQSIMVFAPLSAAGFIVSWIPLTGEAIASLISLLSLVMWILLMIKTYQNEKFEIPVVSDLARQLVGLPNTTANRQTDTAEPDSDNSPAEHKAVANKIPGSRAGRIAESSLTIAWAAVLLIFFNFYHEYLAFYHQETVNGTVEWIKQPFFTANIELWLPTINMALAGAIIGHIIALIWDKYLLRESMKVAVDVMALGAVTALVGIFPFDFSVLPGEVLTDIVSTALNITLIVISIGIGIGILVRVTKLLINLMRGINSYQ